VKRRAYESDRDPVTEDSLDYKLVDRVKVAEILGRHHGIFEKGNLQKPGEGNGRLVAYPLDELTLEEWQAQVLIIMAGSKQGQQCPILSDPQPAGDSTVA
jgi:hypothetical protein